MKERVNAIAPVGEFRRDSDIFADGVHDPHAQLRIRAALQRGFQTRDAETALDRLLANLPKH